MNVRDAAKRWTTVWAQGWPATDVDGPSGSHVTRGRLLPPEDLFG